MKRFLALCAWAILSLSAASLKSEDDPLAWVKSLKVDGFIDAYYKYNPNGVKPGTAGESVFDIRQNSFALAGGRLGLHSADGMGVLDVYFGDYAQVLAGAAPAAQLSEANIGQAFVAEAFGPLTLTLGKYMTHMGYEVTDSAANWNYSRSLLYFQVPFFHVGAKLNYAGPGGLGLMIQADNGNSVNYPGVEATAGGFQVSYSGIKGLATYLNYYYEPVPPGTVWEKKHYMEFISSYNVMDGLDLALDYLYVTLQASQDTDSAGNAVGTSMPDPSTGLLVPYSPKMQGGAFYLNYATPLAGLSIVPRVEAFYMPDAGLSKFDYTLSLKYLRGAVIHWLEIRSNASDDAIYAASPDDPGNMKYSELTVTYAADYKF
jgi:hypothetical protein